MIGGTENESRDAARRQEIRKGLVHDITCREISGAQGSVRRLDVLDKQQSPGADLTREPYRKAILRHVPGLRNVGGVQHHAR